MHPATDRLLDQLAKHFRNSRQGVIDLALSRFRPHVEVSTPEGTKSESMDFQLSTAAHAQLKQHMADSSLKGGQVLRQAIHQLAKEETLI